MAKIQDLPFEILVLIIKDLYLASRGLRHPEWYESDSEDKDEEEGVNSILKSIFRKIHREGKRAKRTFPPEMIWTDDQLCSPAKFPFNVANTCKLWRDAALVSPENWIDLQFDLAYDPRPLLGAISASKTLLFSVHVFTTADDTTMEKSLENERAQAVVQALLLHAERCTSIVFDLTYASSLPSPAPFLARVHPELTTLVFDYKVYNLARCYEGTQIDIEPVPSPLNKLAKVSMCGSAFMDIIHLGTEWLQAQPGSNRFQSQRTRPFPTLHLRDFEFPACSNEMIDGEYTFTRFIHLLHFLSPWQNVHFENISLAYHLHSNFAADAEQNNLLEVEVSSMTLKNVSRDFIAELFQIGNLESMEYLDFVSCSIPRISNYISCFSVSLSDVPAAGALFSKTDDSLYNLILSWDPEGRGLELKACPAFDDNFINWLADDRGDGECEGYAINSITLRNCQNFTARAIRRLVAAVNDPVKLASDDWDEDYEMNSLAVYGKGPRLEDEDISWFEKYRGETSVSWDVRNDDGYTVKKKFLGCE